jgi:hypothetical protein
MNRDDRIAVLEKTTDSLQVSIVVTTEHITHLIGIIESAMRNSLDLMDSVKTCLCSITKTYSQIADIETRLDIIETRMESVK